VAALVFIVLVVLASLTPVLITPQLVGLVRDLNVDIQGAISAVQEVASQPVVLFNVEIPTAEIVRRLTDAAAALLSSTASGAISFAFSVATTMGWLLFILVVSFYFVKDVGMLVRWMEERLPPAYEPEFRQVGRELVEIWDGFFRGSLIVGFIDFLLFAIALTAAGMPNALILALIAGVFALIPSIGPMLASIPAVLLALFQGSTYLPLSNLWFAVVVSVIYLVIFQVDSLYTVPRVVGQRVRLHPALVIIGAVAGAMLGGLLGVLLAAPVMASARVVAGYAYRKLFDLEPFALPAVPAGEVEELEMSLVAGRPVEAVLFDLDGTLLETDDSLAEEWSERLGPVRRILPGGDTDRAARRLVMASERPANGILTLLDRLGLDDETFALARSLRRRRAPAAVSELQLVSGALETLRALAGRYRLGVVTNRSQAEAEALLEREGLQEYLPVVVARDTTGRLKPHPLPIQEAAERLGVDVTRCAMVGDTRVDLRSAKAAGALAVAVLSGFGGRRDLQEADLTLKDVTELKEWL
jgi:predicted PurR-regulated permease PerM/phosphoglycolate phosphatase-like HAD superfamily hydrolase